MSDRSNDNFDELINQIKDNRFEDSSLDVFSEQLRTNHARQTAAVAGRPDFVVNIQDNDFDSLPDQLPARPGRREPSSAQPPRRRRESGGGGKPPREPGRKRPAGGWSGSAWFRAFVIAGIIVAFSVFLALYVLESANDLLGLNQKDELIELEVTENMSVNQIIKLLETKGVVEKPLTFHIYAGFKKALDKLKPGSYVLNSNMSYDEILVLLKAGDTTIQTATVTFYEGMTIWEIAKRLEDNKVCTAQDFVDTLNTADFSSYEFIGMIPEAELRYQRLEGYLFPDTYEFYVNDNPERVAKKFLNNFQNRITDEMLARMNDLNLSLYEAITFASVVQGEAGHFDEMKRVSSVFWNRFNSDGVYPRMESDVTRDYVNYFIKPYLSITNQEMYDAYNTYVCEGLPVAPVNNPGIDAIRATIYPDDTPYFFFVTDINGKFYYSVTLQEHTKRVAEARKVGETHGIAVPD